jgi:hypothetical protein
MINYQQSTSSIYAEMDGKCCQWLDSILESKFTAEEDRCIISGIKKLLQECPEELDDYRGHYLAFKNNGELCDHYYKKADDAADDGLVGAYLFFVPTLDKFSDDAQIFTKTLESCSVEVGRMNNSDAEVYLEPIVPVTLTATFTDSLSAPVHESQRYLFDTGASDTSCPREACSSSTVGVVKDAAPQARNPSFFSRCWERLWNHNIIAGEAVHNPTHGNSTADVVTVLPFWGS